MPKQTPSPLGEITNNLKKSDDLDETLRSLRSQNAIIQTDCEKNPSDPDCITLNQIPAGGKSRRRRKKSRSNKKRKTFRKKRTHRRR